MDVYFSFLNPTEIWIAVKWKKALKIACWKGQTLSDSLTGVSLPLHTAIVARELNRYDVDIAAMSKTRIPDNRCPVEQSRGYTIF